MRPSCCKNHPPLKAEGAGNAGRPTHPQPRVQNKKAHEHSYHGHTGNHPAFPAQWFYGLLRALPGDQACLTPLPALLLADLTPALGRQNDTTSPSASALFVNCAAASTASRPAFVTCARPSVGTGRPTYITDLGLAASKISEIRKSPIGPGGPSPPALSAPWRVAHACSRATASTFEQPARHSHSRRSFLNVLALL